MGKAVATDDILLLSSVSTISNNGSASNGNQTKMVRTDVISTVAGTGIYGHKGDGDQATKSKLGYISNIALDASNNIYIIDESRIRMVANDTGVITTVAGSVADTTGNDDNGDGGQATDAHLFWPRGIVLDASGNIYISEVDSSRIRIVTRSTGVITTIAGNGTSGYSGDGGLATSAHLSHPEGTALDASNNLYIADSGNSCIRMISNITGVITTVVGNGKYGYSGDGGKATDANLQTPVAIAFDQSGNIYIIDANNNYIRMVAKSTGVITSVAIDDGRGHLFALSSISSDATGNLYFVAPQDNRILMVSKSTGVTTTIAGTGVLGYSGDGGKATDARLFNPSGVAVDKSGNIFIADLYNYRIRKVSLYGTPSPENDDFPVPTPTSAPTAEPVRVPEVTSIPTMVPSIAERDYGNQIVGTMKSGYSGDGGAAIDARVSRPYGVAVVNASINALGLVDIYIADTDNSCIRLVSKATSNITTVAGTGTVSGYSGDGGQAINAKLSHPSSVAVDTSDNIYIADTDNHCIRMVTKSTGVITTVAGIGGLSGYSGDGGRAVDALLMFPYGVALDVSGNIYIADTDNHCIRMVTKSSGMIDTVAGTGLSGFSGDGGLATSAHISLPYAVITDASGNIYIADTYNHCIRMVTKRTGIIVTIAGTGVSGNSGDWGNATGAKLCYPHGVAVDESGNIYIADTFNNRMRIVNDSTGVIMPLAGTASLSRLSGPYSVSISPSSEMYIAFADDHSIKASKIIPINGHTAEVVTVAGSTYKGFAGDRGQAINAKLSLPSSVAVDASDNIYIADTDNHCIRMVTKSTGVITTVAGIGTVSGYSGDGGRAVDALLMFPYGVALDV